MVIDFLREENRVLKQQLGRRRLRLTDAQRRRLAVCGKAIGRRALSEVASLVIPDTTRRTKFVPGSLTYRPTYTRINADGVFGRDTYRWFNHTAWLMMSGDAT